MPKVLNPLCSGTYAVLVQCAFAVFTFHSVPSVKTTHAVPSRATAMENGPSPVEQSRTPIFVNSSVGG